MQMQLPFIAMTAPQTSSQAIFKQQWQQAISHLSKSTRNSIIADVIDFQLTGRIPISMSKMRRALFNSFILEIDPNADISVSPLQNSMDEQTVAENETPAAIETVKASKISRMIRCSADLSTTRQAMAVLSTTKSQNSQYRSARCAT